MGEGGREGCRGGREEEGKREVVLRYTSTVGILIHRSMHGSILAATHAYPCAQQQLFR